MKRVAAGVIYRESPLLAQRTREKWGTRVLSHFVSLGAAVSKIPTSRAKNAREMGHPHPRHAGRAAGVVLILAAAMHGQNAPPTIYAESFRKGATRITEESFEVKLNPQDANYRERIKDSAGNDRYELTIVPEGPEGDSRITSWRVRLRDLHHSIYNNILLAEQQPSADPRNNLWWLNASPFAPVPVKVRRVMKVDGFYVLIHVKDLHFTPLDSPYLDSMRVEFAFTNSDPRVGK